MVMRTPHPLEKISRKTLHSQQYSQKLWVNDVNLYLLWFEFLAISPSYELARRFRAGNCTPNEVFPSDFDEVLSVFDNLGDVQKTLSNTWWRKVAVLHFGHQGKPPQVEKVAEVPHSLDTLPTLAEKVDEYFESDWVEQGRQNTILLAIPLGMPEGKINQQIKNHLARIKPDRRQLIKPEPTYSLVGKRRHKDALMRYLRMAWFRSAMHKSSLWRVGAQAEVSETYSPVLDPKMEEISSDNRYDRQMLTIIASRALLRARMIAENAARGRFPTHETCPHALDFDFKEMNTRLDLRNKWQDREIERLRKKYGHVL